MAVKKPGTAWAVELAASKIIDLVNSLEVPPMQKAGYYIDRSELEHILGVYFEERTKEVNGYYK